MSYRCDHVRDQGQITWPMSPNWPVPSPDRILPCKWVNESSNCTRCLDWSSCWDHRTRDGKGVVYWDRRSSRNCTVWKEISALITEQRLKSSTVGCSLRVDWHLLILLGTRMFSSFKMKWIISQMVHGRTQSVHIMQTFLSDILKYGYNELTLKASQQYFFQKVYPMRTAYSEYFVVFINTFCNRDLMYMQLFLFDWFFFPL